MKSSLIRQKFNILLLILLSLIFSACASSSGESVVPTPEKDPVNSSDESVINSQNNEQEILEDDPTPTVVLVDESVEVEKTLVEPEADLVQTPAQKLGLEATNPRTVILASGELQFIELFAFW